MRIRITRARHDEVDGIALEAFHVGLTYDVAPSLATYLITTGSAEPVGSAEPALITPLSEVRGGYSVASDASRPPSLSKRRRRSRR